jgi:hypothetical protein
VEVSDGVANTVGVSTGLGDVLGSEVAVTVSCEEVGLVSGVGEGLDEAVELSLGDGCGTGDGDSETVGEGDGSGAGVGITPL